MTTFILGYILGLASLAFGLFFGAMVKLANARDINDAPCLMCNHQQCRCGDMTGTDW